MKDYSQYHYMELYDMLNHINPYKYQSKIDEIRKEIELRKNRGEVPSELIPRLKLEKEDYMLILRGIGISLYTLFLGFLGFVLINSLFSDGQFSGLKDFFFAFNTLITVLALVELKFLGKVKYLKYVLFVYLTSSLLAFGFIIGFDELAIP